MLDNIRVSEDYAQLQLDWDNGAQSTLAASVLRREARDASSVRERHDRGQVHVIPNIQITALEMVGTTGINIQFSDGHQRAIFPIPYLKQLSDAFSN